MRFSVENYFKNLFQAQLVWPAELSSSAKETSWTFELNFSSTGFHQETPWLKPVEPVSRIGWTSLAQFDRSVWPFFSLRQSLFADDINIFQTPFFRLRQHLFRLRSPFAALFQLFLFTKSVTLIYVVSVTFSCHDSRFFAPF
jgi:hypothetical protein